MVLDWFIKYAGVIAFYTFIVILVYFNRRKFEFEGIIALYRTKLGILYMKKVANRIPKTLAFLGTSGIVVGFLGMFLILFMVGFGLYMLILDPSMPPLFQPVLPGFEMPGGLRIPLLQGLLALFIVVVVHEFAHGVISKLYRIRIKSSGFAMLGPIPAAFVEPDEKKLDKAPYKHQMSMFAAGPFSNVLLAIFIMLILAVAGFGSAGMFSASGVELLELSDPERLEGVNVGDIIVGVDDTSVNTVSDLNLALFNKSPGDIVSLDLRDRVVDVELTNHPMDENFSYLGVTIQPVVSGNNLFFDIVRPVYFWVFGNIHSVSTDTSFLGILGIALFKLLGGFGFQAFGLLDWVFHLSIGIGLVNLLPIGPVDGGRMILLTLQRYFKDKVARKIWGTVSYVLLILVIILIFFPIIRSFF